MGSLSNLHHTQYPALVSLTLAGSWVGYFTSNMINVLDYVFSMCYFGSVFARFAYFWMPERNNFNILTSEVLDLHFLFHMYRYDVYTLTLDPSLLSHYCISVPD